MSQDFSRRISLVVWRDLPSWQVLNTVAHLAAYFGNQLGDQFGTGKVFSTKDGGQLPRNSQFAIIILAASSDQLPDFTERVRSAVDVLAMYFTREMIESTDDSEITTQLATKS